MNLRTIAAEPEAQLKIYTQPPNAQLDYTVDWSGWLEGDETIASVAWVVTTGVSVAAQSNDNTTATVYLLSTGNVGDPQAKVSCTVTSSASPVRRDTRVFFVRIGDL